MTVSFVRCSHNRATRDPAWFFDYVQLIACSGIIAYICASALLSLSPPEIWMLFLCIPYGIPPLFWLYDGWLDRRTRFADQLVLPDTTLGSLTLVGRPAQARRVMQPRPAAETSRYYRTGLGTSQHWVLLIVVLLVLPLIRMYAASPLDTIGIVCVSTVGIFFGQVAFDRRRYRVQSGVLTIEQLTLLSVRHTVSIPLAGSQITCDFAEGQLSILTAECTVSVPLPELLNPHAFAASLVSCTLRAAAEIGSVRDVQSAPSS